MDGSFRPPAPGPRRPRLPPGEPDAANPSPRLEHRTGAAQRQSRHRRIGPPRTGIGGGHTGREAIRGDLDALAARLGARVLGPAEADLLRPCEADLDTRALLDRFAFWAEGPSGRLVLVDAARYTAEITAALVNASGVPADVVVLAARADIHRIIARERTADLANAAVQTLWRTAPELSARARTWLWQTLALAIVIGLVVGGLVVAPEQVGALLAAVLGIPMLAVTALRTLAMRELIAAPPRPARMPADGRALPVYSVMVPLYREAGVLADLVAALDRLDYPRDRLQVLLVLESDDLETLAAAAMLPLPAHYEVVLVPAVGPRTKPKALCYALHFACGDFVTIYDAEDRPEPRQLRRAVAAFRTGPPNLACVQARLNVYNRRGSLLTRQFTIEYSALFDALLPALQRLGMPLPLGGTSNHFRRDLLTGAGAWDPFNVTEDADLGLRLARLGLACRMLPSTTWEEAPWRLGAWMGQRTRWLKGWMQTLVVHMREPRRLVSDLGLKAALGVTVFIGGHILSALIHPLFYGFLAVGLATGTAFDGPLGTLDAWIFGLALVNLLLGYVSTVALGAMAAARRGWLGLALHALLMPLYWLAISAAAYRALYELAVDPYRWQKTEHGDGPRARDTT